MNLAVITNILTPYRVPLFEAIGKRVDHLHVLLMAERERNRDWDSRSELPSNVMCCPASTLNCRALKMSLHVNYGVMRACGGRVQTWS